MTIRRLHGLWRRHLRGLTIATCAASALSLALGVGGTTSLDGPLLDFLVHTRALVFSSDLPSSASTVAVVAVDERSLNEPELVSSPRVLLTPVWAEILTGLMEADAKALGLDLILSYSANRLLPDYDRPFLAALSRYRERIVLAQSKRHVPATPFLAALRFDQAALGLADLPADQDGVYRRVPLTYPDPEGMVQATFARAVLQRAGISSLPSEVLLTPRFHLEKIPTFALIDVLRCAREAPEVLPQVFANKMVLIGSTLAEEDRKVPTGRWLPPPRDDALPLHPCGLRPLGASVTGTLTVPGVFLHAAAIEAVARHQLTATASRSVVAGLSALAAVVGSASGTFFNPWVAALVVGGAGLLILFGAVSALELGVWVPISLPLLALGLSPLPAYVVRYRMEEHARRLVQDELYFLSGLPQKLLEQVARDQLVFHDGGRRADVTIMFADLSGFTKMSTEVPPEVLVALASKYLASMVREIEATGGWANQFLGDCVMAVWGAPLPDPEHAVHGVRAALATVRSIAQIHRGAEQKGEPIFHIKIGVNSGTVLVGKFGGEKRGSYTTMGEPVNVAARLQTVASYYGCQVVVGQGTADLIKPHFLLREVDTVRVKGVERTLTVFEPLKPLPASPEQQAHTERYTRALADYRAGDFEQAAKRWETLAAESGALNDRPSAHQGATHPAAIMAERARTLAHTKSGTTWDGVWDLSQTK